MIISASRRTDIPAFYSDWFYERIREGFVLLRNPMNARQVSRISLSPNVVDGIVFWSKNPAPMFDRLNELSAYTFYFQFTLNSYGTDIEPNVPSKNESVIPFFLRLSNRIGPERVIWRYDPVFLNERYSIEYHVEYFGKLAERLRGATRHCTISFLDFYRKIEKRISPAGIIPFTENALVRLSEAFRQIAKENNLVIDTCAEENSLERYGIPGAACVNLRLLQQLTGISLLLSKDQNQRSECGCVESVDIGAYNTCRHGCLYCYANSSLKTVLKNTSLYDPTSPLLCGTLSEEDTVKDRNVKSNAVGNMLF
ncbi:MAG: DUF1848 domain-containing protein [Planctomycetia bacterium]|nr:DUF1848 domain-containing protein [Planctomycetia bacterium]